MNTLRQALLNYNPVRNIDLSTIISVTVIFVSILAWITTLIVMGDMDKGPGTPLHDFKTFLIGWIIMLTAMMLPSEMQYIKVFISFLKNGLNNRDSGKKIFTYTIIFIAGYGIAWLLYGTFAFLLDMLIRQSKLEFMTWDESGPIISGTVLLLAAGYQISSLKYSCLTHCRSPLSFFARHWRADYTGVLYMGIRHGIVCVLCCWALMVVMFAVGAMNLVWMGILTLFMFAEKIFPFGHKLTVPIAVVLTITGFWIIISPDTVPFLTNPLMYEHTNHHH